MEGSWVCKDGSVNIEEYWARENSRKLYCIRTLRSEKDLPKQEIFQICDLYRGTNISGIQLDNFHKATGINWVGCIAMEPGELANLSLRRREGGAQSEPYSEVQSYRKLTDNTVQVTLKFFGRREDSSYILTRIQTRR